MKPYKLTTSKMYNEDRALYLHYSSMNHLVFSIMCGLEHSLTFVTPFLCEVEFSYMGHSELLCCTFDEYVHMVSFACKFKDEE